MSTNPRSLDKLTVALLGTGRMGQIHLAALARLRDAGLRVGERRVAVEPALYGRDPRKVAELAGSLGLTRTSTDLNELVAVSLPGGRVLRHVHVAADPTTVAAGPYGPAVAVSPASGRVTLL